MVATVPIADEAQRLMCRLITAERPLKAILIAAMLGIEGDRETQKRHVRAIVRHLRRQGAWIVASLTEGYWLTHEPGIWREYTERRTVDARRILAEASRRRRQVREAGQRMLFDATAV